MKTNKMIALVAVAVFALATTKTLAQVDVTASPVSLLWGDFNVGADFKVAPNFSIEANAGLNRGSLFGVKRNAMPVNLIGKYYFNPKHGADGFYADAFLRYVKRDFQAEVTIDSTVSEKVDFTRKRLGVGFGLGYKVVSEKGFVFDIGGGIGRAVFQETDLEVSDENTYVPNWGKLSGFVRLGLGYRFGGGQRRGA